jgi:List-Bact-rpt repeat protein
MLWESRSRPGRATRLALCAALALACLALPTAAQVPGRVNFQGLLLGSGGAPMNGSANLVFRLFAGPTGGIALWTETHNGVGVSNGVYDVALGTTTPLTPALLAGSTRYLEVEVNGEILTPRQPLLSVPYAISAGSLPSFDALNGIPCNSANPAYGNLVVTYGSTGSVTLACSGPFYALTVIRNGATSPNPPPPHVSTPAGISCPSDCTETYVGGTVVTITAPSNGTWIFTGWSGACTGTGSCVVTMDANKSVTATYAPF